MACFQALRFQLSVCVNFSMLFVPPGGLLSTAQSYPSLTTSGPTGTGSCGISTTAGNGPCLSQALTMSLTSTSSDSEQVSLEVSGTQDCAGLEIHIPVEYMYFQNMFFAILHIYLA
jgi:hypothetical protein